MCLLCSQVRRSIVDEMLSECRVAVLRTVLCLPFPLRKLQERHSTTSPFPRSCRDPPKRPRKAYKLATFMLVDDGYLQSALQGPAKVPEDAGKALWQGTTPCIDLDSMQ